MARRAKRVRARQAAKRQPGGAPHAFGEKPPAQGAALLRPAARESVEDPLEDFPDEASRDAWLLEREAEDIQRDGH